MIKLAFCQGSVELAYWIDPFIIDPINLATAKAGAIVAAVQAIEHIVFVVNRGIGRRRLRYFDQSIAVVPGVIPIRLAIEGLRNVPFVIVGVGPTRASHRTIVVRHRIACRIAITVGVIPKRLVGIVDMVRTRQLRLQIVAVGS